VAQAACRIVRFLARVALADQQSRQRVRQTKAALAATTAAAAAAAADRSTLRAATTAAVQARAALLS